MGEGNVFRLSAGEGYNWLLFHTPGDDSNSYKKCEAWYGVAAEMGCPVCIWKSQDTGHIVTSSETVSSEYQFEVLCIDEVAEDLFDHLKVSCVWWIKVLG